MTFYIVIVICQSKNYVVVVTQSLKAGRFIEDRAEPSDCFNFHLRNSGANKSDLYTPRVYRSLVEGGGVYISFWSGYIGFLDFNVFQKSL